MPDSYDLTHLDAHSFEQMVNMLALTVLGAGHTGFGPGADGGRDGFFEGTAPYPQHFLNFLPDPQGHGAFRPTFGVSR